MSAASELLLELWDVGGTRGAKQLQKLSQDPSKVIANARFLGSVEVPMTATMAMNRGKPSPPAFPKSGAVFAQQDSTRMLPIFLPVGLSFLVVHTLGIGAGRVVYAYFELDFASNLILRNYIGDGG